MQSNKHFLVFLFVLLGNTLILRAQEDPIIPLPIVPMQDSITAPLIPANILNDSISVDSVAVDTVSSKQPLLLDKIQYKAKDYVKLSQKDNKIYLYKTISLKFVLSLYAFA